MNRYIVVKVFGVKHFLEKDIREEKNPIFLIFDTLTSTIVGDYKSEEKDALSESHRLNENNNLIMLNLVIFISNSSNSEFTSSNVIINTNETKKMNLDLEIDSIDIIFEEIKNYLISVINNLYSPSSNLGIKR